MLTVECPGMQTKADTSSVSENCQTLTTNEYNLG